MAKSALYTRTGDAGGTSLVGGERVKKNCVRIEAYGTVDELMSALGLVSSDDKCPEDICEQIICIQTRLFNIGSYLATDVAPGDQPECKSLDPAQLEDLEHWVDRLDEDTPKLFAFVLPGGCMLSARAHIARTVCRRAERRILDLADISYVDPAILRYINRLSDYLFILARYFNHIEGKEEIVWKSWSKKEKKQD